AIHALGGTVVVMERFEVEDALAQIEKHRVTTAQFVPTHFVRMLKLPPEARAKYDHSSLTAVFHAAAPCPAAASSSTTATTRRPPRAATRAAGRPWAMWAGLTRRAISTSPTARAS